MSDFDSEFAKLLKRDNESMAFMVGYMLFFLVDYFLIVLIFCSSNPNSEIWQIPHFRLYMSVGAAAIVAMFVYAVYRTIAESARMWKEKDNFYCDQWKQDLSPQTSNL